MVTFVVVLAMAGILLQLLMLVLALFEPDLPYRLSGPPELPIDSDGFTRLLGVLGDAEPHGDTSVEVLTNGDQFYEAELAAIAEAKSHIGLEAYIFQKGEIARRYIAALSERARAGVEVRVVLDAVGSFNTWRGTFRELIDAGGQVRWYIPLRWYNVLRFNHRTHRELLVVDGEVGFIGGAGIADHWYLSKPGHARWRDTMYRVRGRGVAGLQSVLAENWLESSGELLIGPRYYRYHAAPDSNGCQAMVINSAPSSGRATRARMVFQTLLAASSKSIHITTPYFLPDRSVRRELMAAMDRGVEVTIIVPGKRSDHLLTRRSSRRLYGDLLERGAAIFEYRPAMIHAKSLVVDGAWTVVGSTNFDNRSFRLNDEVNLATLNDALAARMEEDFQRDLAASQRITYAEWRRRPAFERLNEWLGWVVERQE